jgi:hypothetical protein
MADAYTAEAAIRARLVAGWTATPPERLRFENDAYIDGNTLAPFCQVEIVGGRDVPYIGAPGARLNRLDGVVMLHLMAPTNEGTAAIAAMFRNARALLSSAIFDGVYMGGLSPHGARPSSEDGAYFGTTATAPFFYLYHD